MNMNNSQQNIVPAKCINQYKIGDSISNLLSSLDNNYSLQELQSYLVIYYKFYKFWILKETKKIVQIGVYKGYKGTFKGIGIGSTLNEIRKKFGNWCESLDIYLIPNYEGICFELEDNDTDEDWIQEAVPIESIFVYDPNVINKGVEFVYDSLSDKYVDKILMPK